MGKHAIFESTKNSKNHPTFVQNIEKMEQLILTQLSLLPEPLQLEALHYIQFLIEKSVQSPRPAKKAGRKKAAVLTFSDFQFPTGGQSFSRSEIYGDDGR